MNELQQDWVGPFSVSPEETARRRRRRAKVIGVGLLAAAVIALVLLVGHDKASSRTVYVVNGSEIPYTVEIDGQRLSLPARGLRSLTLPEGEITVRVMTPEPRDAITLEITSPLLTRAFTDPVFVINPDRAALILFEHHWYSADPDAVTNVELPPDTLHVGEALHQFKKVDFPFMVPPSRVHDTSSDEIVIRTALVHLHELKTEDAYRWIAFEHGEDAARSYLWARAEFEPNNEKVLLEIWKQHELRGDLLRFAESRLDARPLLVELHRMHQSLVDALQPNRDLQAEYQRLFDSMPDEPAAAYLLARVHDDLAESDALMRRAAAANPPVEQAMHAMLVRHFNAGRFDQAAPLARRLREIHEDDAHFIWHEAELFLAMGQLENALPMLQRGFDMQPDNGYTLLELISVLTELGRADEGDTLQNQFLDEARSYSDEYASFWEQIFLGYREYHLGNKSGAIAHFQSLESEFPRFVVAVTAGDTAGAAALVDDLDDSEEIMYHQIAAIAALHHGDSETAESLIEAIASRLSAHGRESRRRAAWLSGGEPVDIDRLLAMPLYTIDRLMYLVLIGQRFPEHRAACFAAAEPFNYSRRFPRLLLSDVLNGVDASQEGAGD